MVFHITPVIRKLQTSCCRLSKLTNFHVNQCTANVLDSLAPAFDIATFNSVKLHSPTMDIIFQINFQHRHDNMLDVLVPLKRIKSKLSSFRAILQQHRFPRSVDRDSDVVTRAKAQTSRHYNAPLLHGLFHQRLTQPIQERRKR